MKNKYTLILSPFIALICYLTFSSSSGGITGVSTTGCGGGGCHGTTATPATILTITGLPAVGYTNGVAYPVTVTVTNTAVVPGIWGLRSGFNMSVSSGFFTAGTGTFVIGTQIRHNGVQAAPGGTKSWTFNWTAPASGSATITFNIAGNLANGDGSPSILDKWKTISQTLIKAPSPLSVTAVSSPAILCNGGTTNITATAINGSPAYQYKLNTSTYQTSPSFTGVLAGVYTVTARDAVLATATTIITITQPTLIVFNAASITAPLCNGGTGTASITATGGTGTKTYTITPLGPQTNTTGNFTGLTAQTYTVTVSDANLCTKTTTFIVTQPTLITFNAASITAPLCNGGVGTASITATGGTGTKTYTITPLGPQTNTTGNFTGLTAQTYTVTVSDANLCTKTTTFTVTQPTLITFNAASITAPLCNGGVGTSSITATGGTGTKTYTITPLGPQTNTTGNFTGLTAQTYTVTVSDANLCTKTTTFIVTQPTLITFNAASITAPFCNGGAGTASITATGGTGTKTYTITPLGPQTNTTGNFTGLTAQTYTVTVSDANLCTKTTTFIVTQPTLITFNAASITSPLCNGGVGTASITTTGGTGTKTYTITPLGPQTNTTGNFTGLTAQTYTITVSDANLCTKTTTFTVTQPTLITFNAASITSPLCNGGAGTTSITATGGTGTKTYTITPLGPQTNTTGNFTGLTAQTYTVTVSDANLCTKTTTFTMTEPAPIIVTSSNVSGCQGSSIALIGSPIGGTFSLPNPYTGPSTTYTYSYTNGSGCSNTSSPSTITVTPVSSANIVMSASTSFCETLTQVSGTNIYSNSSCQLITNITATGLGTTNACVNFLPGTPTYNSEPYANRVYSIIPTVQPSTTATVCLYYTAADLAAAGITVNSDISITKVGGNGVLGGPGSVEEIINTSMTINNLSGGTREVCFPVTSFSSFYLHSKNPNNIPLSVMLNDFGVEALSSSDLVSWSTGCEINHNYFNVQHSVNGIDFKTIGKVESKSNGINGVCNLDYDFNYADSKSGYNFYRLELVDINGKTEYSKTISLYRIADENQIQIYPNPTKGEFNVQSDKPVNISITDINGKQVYEIKNSTFSIIHLKTSGIYFVKMIDHAGNTSVRKLIVE